MTTNTRLAKTTKGLWKQQIAYALTVLPLLLTLVVGPAFAQDDGWQETFKDSILEGWELGPDVAVADGALVIGPGNFAARLGEFADFQFTFNVRLDEEEGAFSLIYYARDESEYALRILADAILLERRSGGPHVALAQAEGETLPARTWTEIQLEVVGGDHRLLIDGEELLSTTDANPLRSGSLVFINMGPAEFAIDDLEFVPRPLGVQPPPEGGPIEESPEGLTEEVPPEPEPEGTLPEVVPLVVSTPTPTVVPGVLEGFLNQLGSARTDPLQLTTIAVNLGLAALFALILGQAYIHWGTSLSNRRSLAANFMLISVTTTFIILIVRSSVALSLGLVGALSIVRFRAAIKEPEELAYLFFAIGLGIGLGDNQRLITAIALIVGLILIGLLRLFRRTQSDMNLHLTVASQGSNPLGLDAILGTLKEHSTRVKLLRFDENEARLETSFLIEFKRMNDLQLAREALRTLSPSLEITFLDNRGIV
jgi:hypothetical protein